MVVGRELRVPAIGVDLTVDFLEQDPASDRDAAAARAQFRQRAAGDVEGQRFTGQVRIRAEVPRQVVLDVRELPVQCQQQIDDPRGAAGRIAGGGRREKMERPEPRERSKTQLQHAGPVDALQRRVGGQPVFELVDECVVVARFAGELMRAGERQPVLVPVDLPDHLVVARLRRQVRDRRPVTGRSLAIVNRILVPRRRSAEPEVAIAEEIVASREHAVGPAGGVRRGVGKAPRDSRRQRIERTRIERESRRRGSRNGDASVRCADAQSPSRSERCACESSGLPAPGASSDARVATPPARRRDGRADASGGLAQLAREAEAQLLAVHRSSVVRISTSRRQSVSQLVARHSPSTRCARSRGRANSGRLVIARRVDHPPIERHPLRAHRFPAVLLAALPSRRRQPGAQRRARR